MSFFYLVEIPSKDWAPEITVGVCVKIIFDPCITVSGASIKVRELFHQRGLSNPDIMPKRNLISVAYPGADGLSESVFGGANSFPESRAPLGGRRDVPTVSPHFVFG